MRGIYHLFCHTRFVWRATLELPRSCICHGQLVVHHPAGIACPPYTSSFSATLIPQVTLELLRSWLWRRGVACLSAFNALVGLSRFAHDGVALQLVTLLKWVLLLTRLSRCPCNQCRWWATRCTHCHPEPQTVNPKPPKPEPPYPEPLSRNCHATTTLLRCYYYTGALRAGAHRHLEPPKP